MIDPTRYLLRALEVIGYGLACAWLLYRLSQLPSAHEPLTLLQAVTLMCLAGYYVDGAADFTFPEWLRRYCVDAAPHEIEIRWPE